MGDPISGKADALALTAKFREYAIYNQRGINELVVKQSRSLGFDLYRETLATAPDAAKIRADAKALGGRLKRGVIARGPHAGKRRSVRGEIGARVAARFFLALGWLNGARAAGANVSGKGDRHTGMATGYGSVNLTAGKPVITIANTTPGIVADNNRYDIVKKAIARRIADMQKYIDRKLSQMKGGR
jgi:hypothetical protein